MVWKNWASRKIDPNTPKYIANDRPLVAANPRERKNRIGSIGAGARSSQATKAITKAIPTANEVRIVALVQPSA